MGISGAKEFLEEVLGRLSDWVKIKVIRADSGFFSGKFFDFAEGIEIGKTEYRALECSPADLIV